MATHPAVPIIEALVAQHHEARASRIFFRADQIRDELSGAGITITKDGWEVSRWRMLALRSVFGRDWPIDLRGILDDHPCDHLAPALRRPTAPTSTAEG